MKNYKCYLSIFKMQLITGMQYRAAAWAGVATQFFWGFMYLMIYEAFYKSTGGTGAMPFNQLVSYIWMQQSFLAIIMLWIQDNDLLSTIASGNVAYELCRPYKLYKLWYSKLMAMRLSSVTLRCIPILIIAFLLPNPYKMMLPKDSLSFLLFILSMALALVLVVAISMFIYILTFITLSPVGARLIIGVGAEFFAGSVIPVPLMPKWLQSILNFLPFRYTSDLPFRIYSGNIKTDTAAWGIFVQGIWIILLIGLEYMAMEKVLRKITIQGG